MSSSENKTKNLNFYGAVYILFIIIAIGLGIIYTNNLDYFASDKVVKNPIPDTTKPRTDLPVIKGTISPPVDIKKLGVSTPELIDKGKTMFLTNCAGCHGESGKGDGVAGASLNPKPRNFTELTGWKNGPQFAQIYKTLQEGIPGSAMASFSNILPEDRIALIHFIQSFRPDYSKPTDTELTELDKTYSLSAGVKQPNQIPVKLAEEKIIQEYKTSEERVKALTAAIELSKDSSAVIFKKITVDVPKAVRTLLANPRWNENEAEFVNLIGTEPVYNGFRTDSYSLSPQDAASVFRYLKNLFSNLKT
jgi:mono/diheme cytochrome c family protein